MSQAELPMCREFGETWPPLSKRVLQAAATAHSFDDEKLRENGRYAGLKRFLQPI